MTSYRNRNQAPIIRLSTDDRPVGSETMSREMPNATNYYRWIVSRLQPFIGQRILDVGGGYGAHLEHIVQKENWVLSLDLSEDSVKFMRERFKAYPGFNAEQADFGQDDVRQDLIRQQFDTITCLNVLEHIENDAAALRNMHAVLAPQKGNLLLQVPALGWLYGSLDQEAGHFRRYTTSSLKNVLVDAGFTISKLHYFNVFGVLPWLINARILRRSVISGVVDTQIRIFDRYLVPMMQTVENAIIPPLGQSVIAVAVASHGTP